MDSFCSSDEEEESQFFDAEEDIVQEPDFVPECPCVRIEEYAVWMNAPHSVGERRREFIRWMRFISDDFDGEISVDTFGNDCGCDSFVGDIHRILESGEAVLRTSGIEHEFSSVSSCNGSGLHLYHSADSSEHRSALIARDVCYVNEVVEDEVSDQVHVTTEGSENFAQLCSSDQCFRVGHIEIDGNMASSGKKLKNEWLRRLRAMACMVSGNVNDSNVGVNILGEHLNIRMQRVMIRHHNRRLKELSALFTGQDIQAHAGSILEMKFNLDGRYLASAGTARIVKIWQVVEDDRSDTTDIPDADPSCVYFSANHISELRPLVVEKDRINKSSHARRTQNSAYIVLPSKVFHILEKPLHVIWGHDGAILDLSWFKNNCLLSSSVDQTVRLWRVGVDHCIKVFQHSDYVTCIQFNPVNDDYFISGSIDGKVRIWQIGGCKVIHWNETRDIITAVTHHPNGQGGIIGCLSGTCCYFDISDNNLQLGTQICLSSKKSPCKRITGFQFLPQDPSKVLVTCADSKIRIIDGMEIIRKFKGNRKAGNHISASITSDGNNIISASDDANVYFWNYADQEKFTSIQQLKANHSFECFFSDASVAIPWPGLKIRKPEGSKSNELDKSLASSLPFSSSTMFTLSQEYVYDSGSKLSTTWPEEKLHVSGSKGISKAQYKTFKSCCHSSSGPHAWGLVIVSARWDGRIRSFHNDGLPASLCDAYVLV